MSVQQRIKNIPRNHAQYSRIHQRI